MAAVFTLYNSPDHKPEPAGIVVGDMLYYHRSTFAGGTAGSTGSVPLAFVIPREAGDNAPLAGECELERIVGLATGGRPVSLYLYDTGRGWELRCAVWAPIGNPFDPAAARIAPDQTVWYGMTPLGGVASDIATLRRGAAVCIAVAGTDGFYVNLAPDGHTFGGWAKVG